MGFIQNLLGSCDFFCSLFCKSVCCLLFFAIVWDFPITKLHQLFLNLVDGHLFEKDSLLDLLQTQVYSVDVEENCC